MKKLSLLRTLSAFLLAMLVTTSAFAAPWKFAVTCDSRANYASDPTPIVGPDGTVYNTATSSPYYDAVYGISPFFKNVAAAMARETGLDFVLFPGDLVRGKKPALNDAQFAADIQQWLLQMKPVSDAGIPVYYVRGNHDAGNLATTWNSNISTPADNPVIQDASQTGLTYSFTHKGSLFVGLDEYPNGTAGAVGYDSTFLKTQLAKQAQHKFVFAHQPVWNYKASELGPAGLADDLNNGGADLYFSGHVHSYQRIAEQGYNFQEMIIGTGGAPQDNPTLGPAGTGYVADPKLSVKSYAGGAGTNARFGYAIITVNDDGSISTEMKFLDDPTSIDSTVSNFDSNKIPAKPWKFGVMSDTQWPNSPDGKNPNVAVNVIKHINQEFINKGVKFVVQVGDLTDTVGANNINLDVRATFAQSLYNNGIGFYPLRGNHESSAAGAVRVQQIFPQTQTGVNNQTPNMVSSTLYGPQTNTNGTFTVGTNFASEPGFAGLTYSLDYNNSRFVFIDQFTSPSGTAHANLNDTDIAWVGGRLASKPANTHAFVFGHKGLITENHNDNLFNSSNPDNTPLTTWPLTNNFMANLQNNGVRYYMGGHDHMHNRAIVASPDGLSRVQNIIAASNSYKFYIPPTMATFNTQTWRPRETQIAQELFTVGYYIFTVDGPKVTVDFYSMPNGCNGDCDQTIDVIPYAELPNGVPFTKHETFGYSLNGKEVPVSQGGSYALTDDTAKAVANGETGYIGTTARILNGTNGSTATDYNNRPLTKTVNTGWTPAESGLASDIVTLWGMTNSLATDFSDLSNPNLHYKYVVPGEQTDVYVLSMTYDKTGLSNMLIRSGNFGLASKDSSGKWVNAVKNNFGGTTKFVFGPWNAGYGLGTYGIDTATNTAWAVLNHNSDFAVASPIQLFSINASTTAGGLISPAGMTSVDLGGDQSYTITPDGTHDISSVLVDGKPVAGPYTLDGNGDFTYAFTNVNGFHNIQARFVAKSFPITTSVAPATGGAITASASAPRGADFPVVITPAAGNLLNSVYVDGKLLAGPYTLDGSGNFTYTFTNVTVKHTIQARFVPASLTFTTISVLGKGAVSISVDGAPVPFSNSLAVPFGSNVVYSFTPNGAGALTTLLIDGKDQLGSLSGNSFSFPAVSASHKIKVVFKP